MRKRYLLDTNVLLHDPESVFSFDDNVVVIPIAVIEEVDNQKARQDEVGRNARLVSQTLDALRARGRLAQGIKLDGGGEIRIEMNHQDADILPRGLEVGKYDNRILAVALGLQRDGQLPVVLVSKDLNMRLKADVLGLSAQDYVSDKVDFTSLFPGFRELDVLPSQIDALYDQGSLSPAKDQVNPSFHPNEYIHLRDSTNPSRSALGRYNAGTGSIVLLRPRDPSAWGVSARNREQRFALDMLLNDSIKLVTMLGPAGTGKTLLALAAGLQKVVEEKAYRRLLITRPIVPTGRDIGYLPGDKDEKLRPWMQPIHDNLEYLMDSGDGHGRGRPDTLMTDLIERGLVEVEALTYIRGRSIPRQFIICDEAQNLTPHMAKTLLTRVGEGTKIVFTGDPSQIDSPYLDSSSNGLTHIAERFKDVEIAATITLSRGERSALATLASELL